MSPPTLYAALDHKKERIAVHRTPLSSAIKLYERYHVTCRHKYIFIASKYHFRTLTQRRRRTGAKLLSLVSEKARRVGVQSAELD